MNRPRPERIAREHADLIQALRDHVDLLEDYADRAFTQGDPRYLGEVAGKLRLLVYPRGRNTPLLLQLMDAFELDIEVTIDRPIPAAPMSLREYLQEVACGIRTSRGFVKLSGYDLIGLWAQQRGASHEDWELDEELATLLNAGIFIGGQQATVAVLRGLTTTVLSAARDVLQLFEAEAAPRA